MTNIGETSDGYHTFNELYEHRHALFMALSKSSEFLAWKSRLHADGSKFDGWFVAGIELPTGQITYHLPERLWDMHPAETLERGRLWDGHTSDDVVDRLNEYTSTNNQPS